ncbi:hypothetical protein AMECASPLE_028857 [Ameca splendens]|uniref:Uncharacterized protein n=1 Tax=Ameca splendens TaxID=208324 RepID=A0ABV0YHP3_9TELE
MYYRLNLYICTQFQSLSKPTYFCRVLVGLVQTVIGQQAGNTLDRSPLHVRLKKRHTRQTTMHVHIPTSNLERPINPTVMFLDCEIKLEYPEKTHTFKGKICKLHAERT